MSFNDLKLSDTVSSVFQKHTIIHKSKFFSNFKISRYKVVQTSEYAFYEPYLTDMKELLTDKDTLEVLLNNDLVRTFEINSVTYYRTFDSLFFKDGSYFDVVRIGSRYSGVTASGQNMQDFDDPTKQVKPISEKMYLSKTGLPSGEESHIVMKPHKFGHFIGHEGQRCNLIMDDTNADTSFAINTTKFDIDNDHVLREKHNFTKKLIEQIADCDLVCYSPEQVVVKKNGHYQLYDIEGEKLSWTKMKAGTFKLVASELWRGFAEIIKQTFTVVLSYFNLIIEKITKKDKPQVINGTDIDAVKILAANHYVLSSFLLLCIVTFFFPVVKFVFKKFFQLIIRRTQKLSDSVKKKCEEISLYGVIPKKIICTFCSTVTWVRKGKFLCDPNVDITKIISPGLFILTCLFVQVEPFRIDGNNAIATVPIKNGYCSIVENINGTMEICLDSAKHYYSKTESYQTGIYNVYYSKNRECKKNGEGTCSDGCINPYSVIGNVNYSRSYCDYKSQPISKCFFQYSCDYYSCGFQPVELYDVYVCDYIEDEFLLKINGAQYQYVAQENVELNYGEVTIMLTQSISNIDRVIHVFNNSFTSPRISYALSPSFGQIGQIQTKDGKTIWNDEVLSCTFDNVYINDIDVFDSLAQNIECDEYSCFMNITSKETILFTITMPLDKAFAMSTSPIKGNITMVDCYNTMQNFVRCNVIINGTSNNYILNVTEPTDQDYICSSPCEINIENVKDSFVLCLESENQFCGVVHATELRYNSTINGSPIYQKAKSAFKIWKIVLIVIGATFLFIIMLVCLWLIITKVIIPLVPSIINILLFKRTTSRQKINGISSHNEAATITVTPISQEDINRVFQSESEESEDKSCNQITSGFKPCKRYERVSIYNKKYKGTAIKNDKLIDKRMWSVSVVNGLYVYSPNTQNHCLFACQLLRQIHLQQNIRIGDEVLVFHQLTSGQICQINEHHVVYVTDQPIEDKAFEICDITIQLKECKGKRFFLLDFKGEICLKVCDDDDYLKMYLPTEYKKYLCWCCEKSRIPVVREIFDIVTYMRLPILPALSPFKNMKVKEHYALSILSRQDRLDDSIVQHVKNYCDNIRITMLQWYIFVCCDYRDRLHLFTFLFTYIKGEHELPDIFMNEYPLSINIFIMEKFASLDIRACKLLMRIYSRTLNGLDLSNTAALASWCIMFNSQIESELMSYGIIYKSDKCNFIQSFLVNWTLNMANKIIIPGYKIKSIFDYTMLPIQPLMNFKLNMKQSIDRFLGIQFTPIVIRRHSIKKKSVDTITPNQKEKRNMQYWQQYSPQQYKLTTIYDKELRGHKEIIQEFQQDGLYIYTSSLSTLCYYFSCLLKSYSIHQNFYFEDYKISPTLSPGEVCKWSEDHVCFCSKKKLDLSSFDAKVFHFNFNGTQKNPLWLTNASGNLIKHFDVSQHEIDSTEFRDYKDYVTYCLNNSMNPVTEDFYLMLRFINFPFLTKLSAPLNFKVSEIVALKFIIDQDKITIENYTETETKIRKKKVSSLQNLLISMLPVSQRTQSWPIILSQNIHGTEKLNNVKMSQFPSGAEKFIENLSDVSKLQKLLQSDPPTVTQTSENYEKQFESEFKIKPSELKEVVNYSGRRSNKLYDKNRCVGHLPKSFFEFKIQPHTPDLQTVAVTSQAKVDEIRKLEVETDNAAMTIDTIINEGKILPVKFILNDHEYNTKDLQLIKSNIGHQWQFIHQSVKLTPLIHFVKFNDQKLPMLKPTTHNYITMTHEYVNIFNLATLRNFFSKIPRNKLIKVLTTISLRKQKEIGRICKNYNIEKIMCVTIDRLLGLSITWNHNYQVTPIDEDIILTYYDILTHEYRGGSTYDQWVSDILPLMKQTYDYLASCSSIEDVVKYFGKNVKLIKPLKYLIAGLMQHCVCLMTSANYLEIFHELAAVIEWTKEEMQQPFVKYALMGDHRLKDNDMIISQTIYQAPITQKELIPKVNKKFDNEEELFMDEMKHWLNKTSVDQHRICYSLLKLDKRDFHHRCTSGMCLFSSCLMPDRWDQYKARIKEFEKRHSNDDNWTNQSIMSAYAYFQQVNYGAVISDNGKTYVLNPTAKVFIQLYLEPGHMMASNKLITDPKLSMIPQVTGVSIDKHDIICNFNANVQDYPPESLYKSFCLANPSQFQIAKANAQSIPVGNYALRPDNPGKLVNIDSNQVINSYLVPGTTQYKSSHIISYAAGHSISFFQFYPTIRYKEDNSGYFYIFGQLYFGFLRNSNFKNCYLNTYTNSLMNMQESMAINTLETKGIQCIGVINPITSDHFDNLENLTQLAGNYEIPENFDFKKACNVHVYSDINMVPKGKSKIMLGQAIIQLKQINLAPEYYLDGDEIRLTISEEKNTDPLEFLMLKEVSTFKERIMNMKLVKRNVTTNTITLWDQQTEKHSDIWDINDQDQPASLFYKPEEVFEFYCSSHFQYVIKEDLVIQPMNIDFRQLNNVEDIRQDWSKLSEKEKQLPLEMQQVDDHNATHGKGQIKDNPVKQKTKQDKTKSSRFMILNKKKNKSRDDIDLHRASKEVRINITEDKKTNIVKIDETMKTNVTIIKNFIDNFSEKDDLLNRVKTVLDKNNVEVMKLMSEKVLTDIGVDNATIFQEQLDEFSEWTENYYNDLKSFQGLYGIHHLKVFKILSEIIPEDLCKVLHCIALTEDLFHINHDKLFWLDTPLVTEHIIYSLMKKIYNCEVSFDKLTDEPTRVKFHILRYLIHFAQSKLLYVLPLPYKLTNIILVIDKTDNSRKLINNLVNNIKNMKFTKGNLRSCFNKISYFKNEEILCYAEKPYENLPQVTYTDKTKLKVDMDEYMVHRRQGDESHYCLEDLLRAGSETRQEVIKTIFKHDNENKQEYDSDFRFSSNILDYQDKMHILNSYCIERPTNGFTDIKEYALQDNTDHLQLLEILLSRGYAVSKLYGITLYCATESRITKYAIIGNKTLMICKCDCPFKYYTTYIEDLNQQDIFYCREKTLTNRTLGEFEVSSHKFTNKFYHYNTKIYYVVQDGLMYITNHHDTRQNDVYSCLLNGFDFGKTYVATTELANGVYCYDGLEFYQEIEGKMRISSVGRIFGLNDVTRIIGVDDTGIKTNKPLSGSGHFPYYNTMTNEELQGLIGSPEQDLENKSGHSNGVYYNKNKIIFVGLLPQSPYRSSVKSYICSKNSGGFCFFSSGDCQHGTIKVLNRFHQHKIDLEIAQEHFGGLIIDVTAGTTLRYCEMFCNVWNLNTPEGQPGPFLDISNISDSADAYVFGDCCYYYNVRQWYQNPRCYQISTYYEITNQITSEYQVRVSDQDIYVQLDGEASPWVCSIEDMVSIMNNTRMIKKFSLNNVTLFCGQFNSNCHIEHNVIFTSKQRNEIVIASNIKNASSKTTFLLTRTSLDPSTISLAQNLTTQEAWNTAQFYDQIDTVGFAAAIERFIPGMHRILVALQLKANIEPDTMFEEILRLVLKFDISKLLKSVEEIIDGVVNIYLGKTDSANRFFKRICENSIIPDGNIYYDNDSRTWKIFTQAQIMRALHKYEFDNRVVTWKNNGEISLKDKVRILWYMLCNDHSSIKEIGRVVHTWVLFMTGEVKLMDGKPVDQGISYHDFIKKTDESEGTLLSNLEKTVNDIPFAGSYLGKKLGLNKSINTNCLVHIPHVKTHLLITVYKADNFEVVHYIIVDKEGSFTLMPKYGEHKMLRTQMIAKKNSFEDCLKNWHYLDGYQREDVLQRYRVDVQEIKDQFSEICCMISNKPYRVRGKEMYSEYFKGIYLIWPFGQSTKQFKLKEDLSNVNEKTTNYERGSVQDAYNYLLKGKCIEKPICGTTNIVFEPTVEEYDCHVNDTATYIFTPNTSAATVPFSSMSTITEVCKYRFSASRYKKESIVKFANFMKPILEDTIMAGIEFVNKSEITIEDYINHLKGSKKKEAQAALSNFMPADEINRRYHLILKNDEMVICDPDKHARVIAAPERTHKLIIGYCAFIIEQFMIEHLKGFMIGKTGEEIRDIIMQDYRNGDNFVSLDTKAFDGSQHLPLQKTIDNELSKIAYMHILREFGPLGTDVLTDLTNIGEIWNNFIKITCGFNVKGKYNLTSCVPSGHALHTTVANTYRAIYYQKYLLNDPDARIYAAGDDTLAMLDDYELAKWKQNMHLVYSPDSLGQTLKELIVSKEYFTFCSMKFTLHDTVIKDLNNYIGRYMTFSNENPIHNFLQKTAAIMDWHNSTQFTQMIKDFSNFEDELDKVLKQHKDFMYMLERDKLLASKELYYTPVSRGVQDVDIVDLYSFFPDIMQLIQCTTVNFDYDHHRPVTRFEFMTNSWYNQVLPNQIIGDFILPYDLDKLESKLTKVFEQIIHHDCDVILDDYFKNRSFKQKKY